MKKFQDNTGRDWEIKITCGTVARVHEELGIDLGDPGDEDEKGAPLATRVLNGAAFFLKVLPVVCAQQMLTREIDRFSFMDLIDADALGKVKEAFMAEWANFFQKSNPRATEMINAMTRFETLKATLPANHPQLKRLNELMDTASQEASESATPLPE